MVIVNDWSCASPCDAPAKAVIVDPDSETVQPSPAGSLMLGLPKLPRLDGTESWTWFNKLLPPVDFALVTVTAKVVALPTQAPLGLAETEIDQSKSDCARAGMDSKLRNKSFTIA